MEKNEQDTEEQIVETSGSDLSDAIDAADFDEFAQIKQMLAEHGPRVLTGVCIGLLIVVGTSFYKTNKAAKLDNASIQLSSARSLQDLESIANQYPSTPSAALALLKTAKIHYNNENLDAAISTYDDFQEKYPGHGLALAAELGKAHCIEAKNELDKALAVYSEFTDQNPNHYLESQAILGKARCLMGTGKKQEAKEIYEEFIVNNPNSEWIPLVEEKLAEISSDG